jgi:hypothetical protein
LRANVRHAAPKATILELSARSGVGMEGWYDYLLERLSNRASGAD